MILADINPFVRFAGQVTYTAKDRPVFVQDCRVFYIIDGEGELLTNENCFEIKKNVLFYCCGGSGYNIRAFSPLKIYTLDFDLTQRKREFSSIFPPRRMKPGEKCEAIDRCDISDSPFMNDFIYIKNGAEFKESIGNIVTEFTEQKAYFRELCGVMLKKILVDLHLIDKEQSEGSAVIRRVLGYIRENYRENLQNSEIAKLAGYHEYYLNRIFVKQMGVSIHKYILNLRIRESERLLLDTDMPVSEISTRIGFNNATHFSSYFKKKMNMTPIEYRRSFKNNI